MAKPRPAETSRFRLCALPSWALDRANTSERPPFRGIIDTIADDDSSDMVLVVLSLVSAAFAVLALLGWTRSAADRARAQAAQRDNERVAAELVVLQAKLKEALQDPEERARLEAQLAAAEKSGEAERQRVADLENRLQSSDSRAQEALSRQSALRVELEGTQRSAAEERASAAESHQRLRTELGEARQQIIDHARARADLQAELAAVKSTLAANVAEHDQHTSRIEDLTMRLRQLDEDREQLVARLSEERVARQELETRAAGLAEQRQELQDRCTAHEGRIDEFATQVSRLQHLLSERQARLAECDVAARLAAEEREAMQEAQSQVRAELLEARRTVDQLTDMRAQLQTKVAAVTSTLEATRSERDQVVEQVRQFAEKANGLEDERGRLSARLSESTVERSELETRIAGLLEQRSDLQARIVVLDERLREGESVRTGLQKTLAQREVRLAELEMAGSKDKSSSEERLEGVRKDHDELRKAFQSLSAEVLGKTSEDLLKLAQERWASQQQGAQSALDALVAPVAKSLEQLQVRLGEVERARTEAYGAIKQEVSDLRQGSTDLKRETEKLVRALRAPQAKGRWGELGLRRVVELSGMTRGISFEEQVHVPGIDGAARPDMVVTISAGKQVVVDAKVTLDAYLTAAQSDDPAVQQTELERHAKHLRQHVDALAKRAYPELLGTPEFTIMFVPGEVFLAPALERDSRLMEYALDKKVVIATPTTLLAMLRSIAFALGQEAVAANAQDVLDTGKELYRRLITVAKALDDVGRHIDRTATSYNKLVASFDGRLRPGAAKLQELVLTSETLPPAPARDVGIRAPSKTLALEEAVESSALVPVQRASHDVVASEAQHR